MFAPENIESLKRLSDESLVRLAVAAGAKLHRFDPEQLLVPNSLRWVIASTIDGYPLLIVQMPGYLDVDTARGLRIDYGGSTVIDQGWRCSKRCSASVGFDGDLRKVFLGSSAVSAFYTYKSKEGAVDISLDGLQDVLKAAAGDPMAPVAGANDEGLMSEARVSK